jgi:F-type H+-transporting ATPase subunit delta
LPAHTENIAQTVEHIYAAALLNLAEKAGQVDEVRQEMNELGDLLKQQPVLTKLLESRVLSRSERAGSIERIFKGNVSELLYRFVQVVNSKDRLAALADIITMYGKLVDRRNGIIDADVFVAALLDDSEVQRISSNLSEALGGNVVLHQSVDPSLIGGLKLRIGDRLIDGSVATQLKRLQQSIVDSGREAARGTLTKYIED